MIMMPFQESNSTDQVLFVRVTSAREQCPPFTVRIDSVRFAEFQEHLDRPIRNIREVMVRQTLSDQFVSVLREVVTQNPLYEGVAGAGTGVYRGDEELNRCVGCMTVSASVKIGHPCNCKPMWCFECKYG